MEKAAICSRYQGYTDPNLYNNPRALNTQISEDGASFVLELEDYLDQNNTYESSMQTDGISFDISKMSMRGYTEDPYLPLFNNDIGNYQMDHNTLNVPLRSSLSSSQGTPQSEVGSYWSSSPDNSGTEESGASAPTYLTLLNCPESYPLSDDVTTSAATAEQIYVHSSSLQSNHGKLTMIGSTRGGSSYINTEIIPPPFDPMSNKTANDDVTIKIEVDDSENDMSDHADIVILSEKRNSADFNTNHNVVIKSEMGEGFDIKPDLAKSIPCPICGMGETGTHNHYGGRACTSCRAFFRRSVQTNSYKSFKCQTSNSKKNDTKSPEIINVKYENDSFDLYYDKRYEDMSTSINSTTIDYNVGSHVHVTSSWGTFECKIDSRSWKSCRFCRFNKCIASGMRPGWVLTKEERILRQTKRSKNKKNSLKLIVNQSNNSSTFVAITKPTIPKRIICPIMPAELKLIDQRQKCFIKLSTDNYIRYFVSRPQILMDVVQAKHYQKILPYEALQHLMNALKSVIKEAITYVRGEDIGKELPESDMVQLIENNASLVCSFSTSVKTSNKPRPKTTFEIVKSTILKRVKAPRDDEERDQGAVIKSVYDALNITMKDIDMNSVRMQYWQFFSSPWASSIEYEQRHLELARQMSFWPVLDDNACIMEEEEKNEKHLSSTEKIEIIDDLQVYLMSAILVFSSEGITSKLKRPDIVDRIQEYYLTMLHRYLKYRYGHDEAMTRLARGIQITSMAREAKEICKTRLPV